MAVSRSLRFEILRRDNHACRYCGAMAPDVKLTVDHVVPVTLGGSDEPSNLVTACADCNGGKSATPPDAPLVEDIAQDALRWRRAMEAANEIASREREARQQYVASFLDRWRSWSWTDSKGVEQVDDLPGNAEQVVGELMLAGLPLPDCLEAVDVALGRQGRIRDRFSYFCGVARQLLARRQSVAAEMVRRGLV